MGDARHDISPELLARVRALRGARARGGDASGRADRAAPR